MDARDTLLASVQEHSPQKANEAGKEKRASRNPEGRPAANLKVTYTAVNGVAKKQRVAASYDEAVTVGLNMLALGELGEVEIEDRLNDVTWRMV